MTRIVNEDLKHIPRTGRHNLDGQAHLRLFYNGLRRENLKLGRNKEQTLLRCIELVKLDFPTWEPVFDNSFFKVVNGNGL
jgi:hypothetical protein